MNKITYVASGLSFIRLFSSYINENEEMIEWIRDHFKKLNENPEHNFAILYNAWIEAANAHKIQKYKDVVNFIEADSGGLQIITRGLQITDKEKKQVFENQSQYSNYAMCFDEIPLKYSGEKSKRLDLSNRWYDEDLLEKCARQTGRNIKEQIECFIKNKSDTKPIFILQGNDYDSYMRWAQYSLEEIPKEYYSFIGGVAMGAAALGHGPLENIRRAFYYTQLPDELLNVRHMHLLAVGSINRILPNMIFLKNGVYKDLHLTYDSTTHTSGLHYGNFYHIKKSLSIPLTFDKIVYNIIYEDCKKFGSCDIELKEYFYCLTNGAEKCRQKFGDEEKYSKALISTALTSIHNFMNHMNACLNDNKEIEKVILFKKENIIPYMNLIQVQTFEDYKKWEKEFSFLVESNPVMKQKPRSLEDFF